MDRDYVIFMLEQRIAMLNKRYRLACHGKDEQGNDRGTERMAQTRHATKRDSDLCSLVLELVRQLPKQCTLDLSEFALEGLEKIMEPIERHRRLVV